MSNWSVSFQLRNAPGRRGSAQCDSLWVQRLTECYITLPISVSTQLHRVLPFKIDTIIPTIGFIILPFLQKYNFSKFWLYCNFPSVYFFLFFTVQDNFSQPSFNRFASNLARPCNLACNLNWRWIIFKAMLLVFRPKKKILLVWKRDWP